MDALTELNEHFLSCNICTEIFKDPCTLGCYHTFCRVCLTRYNMTRRDAIDAKSILCPNCCQMTKVPRPQEPVDLWCQQFKPSFLIQGLLDTFSSQGSSGYFEHCCFTCQQMGNTTQAKSVCKDCDILFCKACVKVHQATPITSDHVISPLGAGSTPQLNKHRAMCKEHNCLVEFCCKDCQKPVCNKCCMLYHRKCNSVVKIVSMVPEMKQALHQDYDYFHSQLDLTGSMLKSKRLEVEEISQRKYSLQSDIRRVGQQAVDLIRRKEKKLLDELDMVIQKQTEELRSQIKSGEIDLQTYQQYAEFIKQVLQTNSPMDLFDMYRLCQSGEITAEIRRKDKCGERASKVEFENQLDMNHLERTLQLGHLKFKEDKFIHQFTPLRLLSKVSTKSTKDKKQVDLCDIEVFDINGTDTLVLTDLNNSSVKSCYTRNGEPYCSSLKLDEHPRALTKINQNTVAVSHWSHNRIQLVTLTPDPVCMSSIKTKKKYRCLTTLHDETLAAACRDPPSIDVLDLSGRVLRSVITPSTGQQLIQEPWYMCTTGQGHIIVTDDWSDTVYCVTQRGEILFRYSLTGGMRRSGGVAVTDSGSVIVADSNGCKITQLTETGEYMREMLTGQDGIVTPWGIRVHKNKMYVTENNHEQVKIFQL